MFGMYQSMCACVYLRKKDGMDVGTSVILSYVATVLSCG